MHIVILINQAKQQLETEISQSRLNFWLKRASIETLPHSDVWTKLHYACNLPQDSSLATTLAKRSDISGPCLIATPVKVVLGMRDSECHLLDQHGSLISQSQISEFNDFFKDIFKLHTSKDGQYLLEFSTEPEFNLAKQCWPPYCGDYRVQVQAA